MDYSLPQAAMRLRQGFGRLMRRKSDRGIVCILDSRIIRKSYGRILLETLPETVMRRKGREELLREFEDFLWSTPPKAEEG
jgi:ATP-dependent DNA helicase DinG